MSRKANYGVDSPGIIAGQFVTSVLGFALALAALRLFGLSTRWIGLLAGIYFLNGALSMLHYSKIGKLRLREQLMNGIRWRGDELVLDAGCGRGLLLVAAARRLTTGYATGVDVWLPHALSGNGAEAALENAAIEGVAGRVSLERGDVRQLPFDDASFDVVVSNFVLHELNTGAEREKMLHEIVRVAKPGGRVVLVDFIFTNQCKEVLMKAGMENVMRSRIGRFSFWISAILTLGAFQLYRVTGSSPTAPAAALRSESAASFPSL